MRYLAISLLVLSIAGCGVRNGNGLISDHAGPESGYITIYNTDGTVERVCVGSTKTC